jgi:hypothetical protein
MEWHRRRNEIGQAFLDKFARMVRLSHFPEYFPLLMNTE